MPLFDALLDRGTPAILATEPITRNGYSAALPCTDDCPKRQRDRSRRAGEMCPHSGPRILRAGGGGRTP
ncbi:hypothetical protein GCM10011583_35300 [Streptomyces camponoticapitis]|uniref:Uncharacterized protein n=1 Tax=Streptomyces camponoticapitis TaxID=1616125 RepID=A0ABQ2E8J4_9ACTN|nr:hypothetical protein GCM10011583_35300 [Streptomyces camponoticapitis]